MRQSMHVKTMLTRHYLSARYSDRVRTSLASHVDCRAIVSCSEDRNETPMTNDRIDKTLRANRRDFLVGAVGAASMSPRAILATAATTTVLAEATQPASARTANAASGSSESKLSLPLPGYLSFGP